LYSLEEKEIDARKIIKDLEATNLSGSNKEQGKFAQMIKGLAFSNEEISNQFMKELDKVTTEISKKILGEKKEKKLKEEIISDELENIIDRNGLLNVLGTIEEICYLKADHLRTNWQDEVSAKAWENDGKLISKILNKIINEEISNKKDKAQEFGAKDGSEKGKKKGGLRRNQTLDCRHPELKNKEEEKILQEFKNLTDEDMRGLLKWLLDWKAAYDYGNMKLANEVKANIIKKFREEQNRDNKIRIKEDIRVGDYIIEAGEQVKIIEPYTLQDFANVINYPANTESEIVDVIIQMASSWTLGNISVDFEEVSRHITSKIWDKLKMQVGNKFLKELERYLDKRFDKNPNIIKEIRGASTYLEKELRKLFKPFGLKVNWTPDSIEIVMPSEDWYWNELSASGKLEEFNELIQEFGVDYDIVDNVIVIFI